MTAQTWRVLTFGCAVATGALLAGAPLVATSSCTTTAGGQSSCASGRESLLSGEGAGVLLVLAVPALLALAPVLVRSHRATLGSAVALTLAALLGVASVGIFLIPTLALAWVAAARTPRPALGTGRQ